MFVLVGLGIGAAAGCGGGDADPGTTGTANAPAFPTVDMAANTRAICGRLANINFAGDAAFKVHWNKLLAAVAAGDEAAGAAAGEAAKQEAACP